MAPTYEITVENKSGVAQTYTLFSGPIVVSGGPSGSIWSTAMRSSAHVAPESVATFKFTASYHAICGSFEGSPEENTGTTITKTVPVALGSRNLDGSIVLGSTAPLIVNEKLTCDLGQPTTPGAGRIGNFHVNTTPQPGHEFSIPDARMNNLLLGVGVTMRDAVAPVGGFIPYPNTRYQISPPTFFNIASGDKYEQGQLIKSESVNNIAIDFAMRTTFQVQIIHNNENAFSFKD